jgi:prepilin-type N-terminal cleavage/methylation domain-containing protein/prepilin-type processing-associated H-X9-DG protein
MDLPTIQSPGLPLRQKIADLKKSIAFVLSNGIVPTPIRYSCPQIRSLGAYMLSRQDSKMCAPRRGFTLVELLVVIGIIAVLISLLMPAINRARDSANRIKCGAQLRQMAVAVQLYANDHDGAILGQVSQHWMPNIRLYIGKKPGDPSVALALICPADTFQGHTTTAMTTTGALRRSYALNNEIPGDVLNADGSVKTVRRPKLTRLRRAAEIILFVDWSQINFSASAVSRSLLNGMYKFSEKAPLHWHRGTISVLFADGHVESGIPATNLDPGGVNEDWWEWDSAKKKR